MAHCLIHGKPSVPMNSAHPAQPHAHLLISSHCPHCQSVLSHLTSLVKSGELAHLQIDNVDQQPELAQQLGVRSLPWLKLGSIELTGAHSLSELKEWISKAASPEATDEWFTELMSTGQVEVVIEHLKKSPGDFDAIVRLLGTADTELVARIGIGVIMETFAGEPFLKDRMGDFIALTGHEDERVRADACHYLGLIGDRGAIPTLQSHLNDSDADVREAAEDAIAELEDSSS